MAVILRPLFGVHFLRGCISLKKGLSAPSLERAQLCSRARFFLYT
jgi:hypothetical protein